jgi:hypothetical protein
MKLPDNFQMREHSWQCRFHIILETAICTLFSNKYIASGKVEAQPTELVSLT